MSTDQQDLRERIAATLAAHDLPDNTDRDGQWAADALIPLITAEMADRDARIRTQKAAVAARDSRITELESRIARKNEETARLQRLLAQTRQDKWAARWDAAELQAHLATELTRHDQAHGHYETTTAPTHGGHDE